MKTREEINKLAAPLHKRIGATARNVGAVTDEYVHENAWTTLTLAAVIGCVVGFLLGHRRD